MFPKHNKFLRLLCINIIHNSSFDYTNNFSKQFLTRHPTVYLLPRRKKVNAKKKIEINILQIYETG